MSLEASALFRGQGVRVPSAIRDTSLLFGVPVDELDEVLERDVLPIELAYDRFASRFRVFEFRLLRLGRDGTRPWTRTRKTLPRLRRNEE